MSKVTMWRSRWRCVIKRSYSFSFLLSINIFVWQNVLYFLDAPRTYIYGVFLNHTFLPVFFLTIMHKPVEFSKVEKSCHKNITAFPIRQFIIGYYQPWNIWSYIKEDISKVDSIQVMQLHLQIQTCKTVRVLQTRAATCTTWSQ